MFSKRILHFTLFLLLITLSACKATPEATPAPPTTDPNIVRTAAAQTADARLEAIPSPTPMPPTPDEAALTQTADAIPTATIEPTEVITDTTQPITSTVAGITPTATSPTITGADNATFVKDITIPDDTAISPESSFTKTWQFLNAGTSTWTTDYQLAWVSGDQLGNVTVVNIPMEVPAGQVVDISVELTAPSENGTYKSFWRMLSPNGQHFGDAVYVQIKVGEDASDSNNDDDDNDDDSIVVSNLFATVDNGTVAGICPHTFTINIGFDLKEDTTVTYQLEAGGFTLTLPEPQTQALSAGTHTFAYELEISQSGTGWARLHITSPVDKTSSEIALSLTCE